MACRGVLFALSESDLENLRALDDQDDRIDHVGSVIEPRDFGGQWAAETDKAWDAIHRCFNNGMLDLGKGEYPFNHIILGGEQLVTSGKYYITLKTPEQVRDVAARIGEITEADLKQRYRRINPKNYGLPLSDEDEAYTWEWFSGLVDFYRGAAAARRWVIFTVDQ